MRHRFPWAVAFMTLFAGSAAVVGCEGETSTVAPTGTGTTSSSSSGTGSSSSSGGGQGGGGGGLACDTTEGLVFAVNELYFGEGISGEWKKVGYDLDGKTSTANSKDLCMVNTDAMTSVPYPDGDNGIDNSFGKNLLPTILSLYPTWVTDINNGVDNGGFTALIKMLCITPDSGDVPQFTTKFFGGTTMPMPPKQDGTDVWPIEPGLLMDPADSLSTTVLFPNSSIKGDLYDAGKDAQFIISVPVKTMTQSTSLKLTLYNARITMNLSADRKTATGGMIGGILDTEEFIAEVTKVGYLLELCGTSYLDNLIKQVRQSSDIMVDGTQDPTKVCNGITMGLGFDMVGAVIGDVGPKNPDGATCP